MTAPTEISGFEIAPGYDGFAVLSPEGGTVGLILLAEMFGVTPAMEAAARGFERRPRSRLALGVMSSLRMTRPVPIWEAHSTR